MLNAHGAMGRGTLSAPTICITPDLSQPPPNLAGPFSPLPNLHHRISADLPARGGIPPLTLGHDTTPRLCVACWMLHAHGCRVSPCVSSSISSKRPSIPAKTSNKVSLSNRSAGASLGQSIVRFEAAWDVPVSSLPSLCHKSLFLQLASKNCEFITAAAEHPVHPSSMDHDGMIRLPDVPPRSRVAFAFNLLGMEYSVQNTPSIIIPTCRVPDTNPALKRMTHLRPPC